jgi:hypothetical protein
MPAAAQLGRWPYYDPDLIEKLYKNDYQHVGNDNASRQDLIAVIAAFGLDPDAKCSLVTDDSLAGGAKLAGYISFLQSDSRTGQYPSAEASELAFVGALYPDPPYVYINDPNLVAMAREIETHKCKSDRIQTIRRNFVQLLDDRIAGRNIPASAASPRPAPPPQPTSRLPQPAPVPQPAISPQEAAAQQQAQAAAAAAAAERAAAERAAAERAQAERAAVQTQRVQLAQQQTAKAQECTQRLQADQAAGRPQQEIQQTYLTCVQEVQKLGAPPGSAAAAQIQQTQDKVAKAQQCAQQLQADQGAGRPQQAMQQRYMACLQELQQLPTR